MFGKKVVILEKHYVVGGLNSFFARKGRKFDVGLHAVTNLEEKPTRIRREVHVR
jgi:phytoene dehydrogenase-like protein